MTFVVFEPDDNGAVVDNSGRLSRRGYFYQDLCALRYCLDLLASDKWDEIWCESHDDFVLVRSTVDGNQYRLVQVKYRTDAPSHWSWAMLIKRNNQNVLDPKESILIKMFMGDRFPAPTDFRLVINEGVQKDLRGFHYRWKQPEPIIDPQSPAARKAIERMADWSSPDGRGPEEFICRLGFETHAATIDEMEASVSRDLVLILNSAGEVILTNEIERVQWSLYELVFQAGASDPKAPGIAGRITRDEFRDRLDRELVRARQIVDELPDDEPGSIVETALRDLGLTDEEITFAKELRQAFFKNWRLQSGSIRRATMNRAMDDVRACYSMEKGLGLGLSQTPEQLFSKVLRRIDVLATLEFYQSAQITLADLLGIFYFLIGRRQLTFKNAGNAS